MYYQFSMLQHGSKWLVLLQCGGLWLNVIISRVFALNIPMCMFPLIHSDLGILLIFADIPS